jgi:hypothetical protein
VAPLGAGVVDTTAGSALVTGWFTGHELKQLLNSGLLTWRWKKCCGLDVVGPSE